jgi:hypothetical protein
MEFEANNRVPDPEFEKLFPKEFDDEEEEEDDFEENPMIVYCSLLSKEKPCISNGQCASYDKKEARLKICPHLAFDLDIEEEPCIHQGAS